jgi:hypothetical protein
MKVVKPARSRYSRGPYCLIVSHCGGACTKVSRPWLLSLLSSPANRAGRLQFGFSQGLLFLGYSRTQGDSMSSSAG